MQPEIIKKKFLLVGLETKMDLSSDFSEAMSALRGALRKSLPMINDVTAPVRMVGIWLPDTDAQNEMSPKRVYFTGVEVTQISNIPAGCIVKDIPESLYAKFREESRGTMSRYAYAEWLPMSGYLLNIDLVPGDFEIFDDMEHDDVNDPCDILLPILPSKG